MSLPTAPPNSTSANRMIVGEQPRLLLEDYEGARLPPAQKSSEAQCQAAREVLVASHCYRIASGTQKEQAETSPVTDAAGTPTVREFFQGWEACLVIPKSADNAH